MPNLIAIAYQEETIAGQAAGELERRADDLAIDPDAIGAIVCERDGRCQLTTSRRPGATAAWSKFWGVILGAVMGEAEMTGLDPSFRERINRMLTPATSVVLVVVWGRTEPSIQAVSQYEGTALRCSLTVDSMEPLVTTSGPQALPWRGL